MARSPFQALPQGHQANLRNKYSAGKLTSSTSRGHARTEIGIIRCGKADTCAGYFRTLLHRALEDNVGAVHAGATLAGQVGVLEVKVDLREFSGEARQLPEENL